MKIAFYAPMKAPSHPSPSGDRQVARLLVRALQASGHRVELVSTFRSWEGRGDRARQRRLQQVGLRLGQRAVRHYLAQPQCQRPKLWFSYHLYHKAPDWLGPLVSRRLGIPYVVAEASYASKQIGGPWSEGLEASVAAIRWADAIFTLNSNDLPGLRALLGSTQSVIPMQPFLPPTRALATAAREQSRADLAARFGLCPEWPWLLAVAMMRPGDKLASYHILAQALARLEDRPWNLLVVGDGSVRTEVETAFAQFDRGRVTFAGQQPERLLPQYRAAADLFTWPAVNEAYGMALLEAQAAGLPVVAGRSGGVADIVRDGITGMLTKPTDPTDFSAAVATLLKNPERRAALGQAARRISQREHGFDRTVGTLREVVDRVTAEAAA